ncbi:hypothetical protein A3I56_04260 [Candidatus Roizmanbacteria bacterium RIFCSPLOWO2_02_FULL_43_10]|uniref:Uncharacterized protein n=1 Tax=Candidatus Roizmanbacteria bacterium RIFCSPLOWO2_02_FULL_43_10 TaxID=1802078 RepID=A0A1F7K249_9BACT|nr:MAG: hypothetical protein A3I56_04260 [Candidatus Roizmanbacteria bacterium RIFCSPLOWO2_02_FULL_43_10]
MRSPNVLLDWTLLLPTSASVPEILLNKEVMAQVKNQMDMIKDVEENKVISADADMEVVSYEKRRAKKKTKKNFNPVGTT